MARFSPQQCKEILARIASFPFLHCISHEISQSIYKSFVGRDFKTLAQLALFVFPPLLIPSETEVWLALSKVCVTHLYMYLYAYMYHLSGVQDGVL